jgi:hypothetical protein
MAVKVWQGEQQQRQDDLSKVDGTGRNKGCVFMLEVVVDLLLPLCGEISGANGTPCQAGNLVAGLLVE